MKSEFEIAKRNVERGLNTLGANPEAKEHLASCKRFLEFLELFSRADVTFPKGYDIAKYVNLNENKINDLKKAIQTYYDEGIK